jgi:hypothetical protein
MNALRGMKLCYQDRDTTKAWTATIRVIYIHFADILVRMFRNKYTTARRF